MKNQNNRQKMIAKIHIAKSQLGLDDDTYRALLACYWLALVCQDDGAAA